MAAPAAAAAAAGAARRRVSEGVGRNEANHRRKYSICNSQARSEEAEAHQSKSAKYKGGTSKMPAKYESIHLVACSREITGADSREMRII